MTMTIGYDRPLYVLPFDHRATFSKNMFGWQEPLSPDQTAEIAAVKQVIYDAFKAAVAGGGEGPSRHPRGRGVRRGHSARRAEAGVHHRLFRGEERPGRVRLRVRPGVHPPHRTVRP